MIGTHTDRPLSDHPHASASLIGAKGLVMGTAGARFSKDVGQMAEQVVELLQPLGDLTWRKMFGGAGIFEDGSMFALIDSNARLHLKADDSNRDRFETAGAEKHGRMPYYAVPDIVVDDDDTLLEWARASVAVNGK